MADKELRIKLHIENAKAWQEPPDPESFKHLDSNLKRSTAFINKCRTRLGAEILDQLKTDISKLRLEKYLSEVVTAIVEGLARCKNSVDIQAAAQVCSLLHQRFPPSFTLPLAQALRKIMEPPSPVPATVPQEQRDREETARITRQRQMGRVITEFWLCGLFSGLPAMPVDTGSGSRSSKSTSITSAFPAATKDWFLDIYVTLVRTCILGRKGGEGKGSLGCLSLLTHHASITAVGR